MIDKKFVDFNKNLVFRFHKSHYRLLNMKFNYFTFNSKSGLKEYK